MAATPPAIWWNWTFDKIEIGRLTGLADDTLHTHAGLLVITLAALILRRPPWDWRCWLAALAVELLNETWDLFQPFYPTDEGNIPASLHDLWVTMLWPTIILLTYPRLARRATRSTDQRFGERPDVRADILS
jgi:hypothetical protein